MRCVISVDDWSSRSSLFLFHGCNRVWNLRVAIFPPLGMWSDMNSVEICFHPWVRPFLNLWQVSIKKGSLNIPKYRMHDTSYMERLPDSDIYRAISYLANSKCRDKQNESTLQDARIRNTWKLRAKPWISSAQSGIMTKAGKLYKLLQNLFKILWFCQRE